MRRDARFQVTEHASGATAREALGVRGNGIMIADLETVGGAEELSAIADGQLATIATSASASLNDAVAALRGGAVDFLPKPVGARALLKRLVETVHAPKDRPPGPAPQPKALRIEDDHDSDFAGFIGRSPVMQANYAQIKRVAGSRAPVFITGASGTGKEICAKAIHRHDRASGGDRPFIAINCSAIPSELMESEMFGHVRGAFTGAIAERTGAAELAHGGTLFLDEISEMGPGPAGKVAAFPAIGRSAPGRRHGHAAGRNAHHLRDKPRSGADRGFGRFPPGPVLQAACAADPHVAAPPARRRHSAPRGAFPATLRR